MTEQQEDEPELVILSKNKESAPVSRALKGLGMFIIRRHVFTACFVVVSSGLFVSCNDQTKLAQRALTSSRVIDRIDATMQLTNQVVLARIAATDGNPLVYVNALEKLTDQVLLAQVAITAHCSDARAMATQKLTDQALLARIAATDIDDSVRRSAAGKLTDQALLARIAATDMDYGVREAAVKKLTAEGLSLVAEVTNDLQQQALLLAVAKFLRAEIGIPEKRRSAVLTELMPLTARYAEPFWVSRFGSLATIAIKWVSISQMYEGAPGSHISADGEQITIEVTFTGLAKPLSAMWNSEFPPQMFGGTHFVAARVRLSDAFIPWLDGDIIAQIATTDINFDFREAAVKRLTDQALLARIATTDMVQPVRKAAVEKLTDQNLLTQLANTAFYDDVRREARSRLVGGLELGRTPISIP